MKSFYKKNNYWQGLKTIFLAVFFVCIFFCAMVFTRSTSSAQAVQDVTQNATVNTTSAGLVTRVAPGDILPISVKLLNFGGGQKVDVTIGYGIFNSKGVQVYITTETVAVETTANFVKTIQIPFNTPPGEYVAKASIIYQDQIVPATTQFSFTVENKILGLFQSDFYFYGIIILIITIVAGLVGYFWTKQSQANRLVPYEYNKIPKKERIFYKIISDTIMEMRYRVGDKALDIAKSIDDLVIDEDSGKVLQIKADPAKIIAALVLKYEKSLGQKMSFAFERSDERIKNRLADGDKNLIIIKKYPE
jgi:hypothetical protein